MVEGTGQVVVFGLLGGQGRGCVVVGEYKFLKLRFLEHVFASLPQKVPSHKFLDPVLIHANIDLFGQSRLFHSLLQAFSDCIFICGSRLNV